MKAVQMAEACMFIPRIWERGSLSESLPLLMNFWRYKILLIAMQMLTGKLLKSQAKGLFSVTWIIMIFQISLGQRLLKLMTRQQKDTNTEIRLVLTVSAKTLTEYLRIKARSMFVRPI